MSPRRFVFASIADAPRVAALIELAYRGPEAAKGWTNEAAILSGPRSSVAEVERLIRGRESRFLMALEEDRLLGCALLQKHGEGAYFGMFAIDPAEQQKGVGKQMMLEAENAARFLWGAKYLRLTVISLRDQLIEWYVRRGFRPTGEREPFPFGEHAGALRTDFDLVVLQKPL